MVGFKAGAPEQIAIKEFSEFVEYGDVTQLCNAVHKFINKENVTSLTIEAESVYSKNI